MKVVLLLVFLVSGLECLLPPVILPSPRGVEIESENGVVLRILSGKRRIVTLSISNPYSSSGNKNKLLRFSPNIPILRKSLVPEIVGREKHFHKYYYIIVKEKGFSTQSPRKCFQHLLQSPLTYTDYAKVRSKPYIAAVFNSINLPQDRQFILGDGTKTTSYLKLNKNKNRFFLLSHFSNRNKTSLSLYNGPLFSRATYEIAQVTYMSQNSYEVSDKWLELTADDDDIDSRSVGIAAVLIIVIVICIIALLALLLFGTNEFFPNLRQTLISNVNKKVKRSPPDSNTYKPITSPIPVNGFHAHVQKLSANSNRLFTEEYTLIQNVAKTFEWTDDCSNYPNNRCKNRYGNISAYDHTRVCLEQIDGVPETDYVNANYIEGLPESDNIDPLGINEITETGYVNKYTAGSSAFVSAYIASQGPLDSTCDDFWRMCFEKGAFTIVMLTRCVENGKLKCAQYWPDEGVMTYGLMTVTMIDVTELPLYVIRTFIVSHEMYPDQEKLIRQFHFLGWPDHGTPTAHELLTFMRRVNQISEQMETPKSPVVVHCSAGVGRTGTYIVLEENFKKMAGEENIDIFNYVSLIRTQRNFMVQTQAQYVFVHECILEHMATWLMEIPVDDVNGYVEFLLQGMANEHGQSPLDVEFNKLKMFDRSATKTMNAAKHPVNKNKNRFLNLFPFDQTRVMLRVLPDDLGSDYINASYIHGYSRPNQFIATEAPLLNTMASFWRMIWEQSTSLIVCLTQESEEGKSKMDKYWPTIESVVYGSFMIDNVSVDDNFNDFVYRRLEITHMENGSSRIIKHFQYKGWQEKNPPENPMGMINLITHVSSSQEQIDGRSIVVHCSSGVGRTGVFIGLCNLIERAITEKTVNVFNTVQVLRDQRQSMVQSKEQYLFIYRAIQDYLISRDNDDLYENAVIKQTVGSEI